MSNELDLTVKKIIPASCKEVFDAWLDPEALSQFMLPMEGMPSPKVKNDPRVGGKFLIEMKAGDQELPHTGEYKVINKYDKIAFTWESAFGVPGSLVTLSFKELAANETELILHHVGFSNEESRDNHFGGWGRIADTLKNTLS